MIRHPDIIREELNDLLLEFRYYGEEITEKDIYTIIRLKDKYDDLEAEPFEYENNRKDVDDEIDDIKEEIRHVENVLESVNAFDMDEHDFYKFIELQNELELAGKEYNKQRVLDI